MPSRFAALIRDARYPVRIEIAIENGRAHCVGLARIAEPFGRVDGSDERPRLVQQGPPITAELLREIPLKRLVGEISATAADHFGRAVPQAEETLRRDAALYARLAEIAKKARAAAGDNVSDELISEVAKIYDEAVAAGSKTPTKATWTSLQTRRRGRGPAYSTVARWVSIARERGHLPPTNKGKARAWRDAGKEPDSKRKDRPAGDR